MLTKNSGAQTIGDALAPHRQPMTGTCSSLSQENVHALLGALVAQSPIPMVVVSYPDQTIWYANQSAGALFGILSDAAYADRTLAEAIKRRTWSYLYPDGRQVPPSDHPLAKAMRGVHTCNQELYILRQDGSRRLVLINANPIYDSGGTMLAGLVLYHDITEHRRAEEALQASEERFKRLLENSNDIITVADATGLQRSISGPLQKTFGYAPEELIGTNGFENIHPEDMAAARQVFAEALTQPGITKRVEYRYRHKDGQWIPLEIVGANLLHDPAVQGIVLNIRDISERIHFQEQLNQAMKMEAVGRLAGGVAHDFNNLLTAISGNAQLARIALRSGENVLAHLDEISKACTSAAGLIRQLLSFSRRQIIEPVAVDLNALILNIRTMLERLLGEDIVLQTALAEDLHPVKIDPGQFEQVCINLAVNARDAMPGGGTLKIATTHADLGKDYCAVHPHLDPGSYSALTMTDTGLGLSDEAKKHLFEPFFTTKPQGVGTGLGLATIFGTVKQAGGHIEAHSQPGKGTSFTIYLPITEAAVHQPVPGKPLGSLSGGHETILVVEDEPSVRNLVVTLLQRLGYRALPASNGAAALQLAERHAGEIQLLITDVVMPGMNGRELAAHMLRHHPDTRVIFTSGYTEDVIIRHGVMEESLNFIGKPYSLKALAQKVRDVLDAGTPSAH